MEHRTEFRKGGSANIQNLIRNALANGQRRAMVVGGNWEMEEAVRIPSDFTLILDNCHLRMADNTFDNMFVNEHHGTEIGKTVEGTDRYISIIGRGEAIIDGGNYNGLSEKNSGKDGMPHVSKNNLLFFTNVDGFQIRNIAFHNQRWWALNFIYCSNGELTDLTFKANDTNIDEQGNIYHGLSLIDYFDMQVKQADGIDIRQGCHHINIENIRGFAGDDLVAITALDGHMEQQYAVAGLPKDICYIKVKNIIGEALDSNVRLLNQGGYTLHDILIDTVEDTSGETSYLETHPLYGIRVNDAHHLYGIRHSTEDETYNIIIKNVRSRACYAIHLGGRPIKNFVCENIVAFDGACLVEDKRIQEE